MSDLTPLGVHFDRCSSDAEWPLAQVADGNGDGLIALNDVTPIGQYFGVALEGYILQESESGAEPWNEVARLPLSSSTAPIAGGLRLFAATIPGLTAGRSYRVVPVLGADTGVPSTSFKYLGDPRPTSTVSGMIFRADGTPVGGVAVVFGSRAPVSTDSAGQFEIAAVPDGESGVLSTNAAGTYFLPRQRYVHVSSAAVTDQDFTAFAASPYPARYSPSPTICSSRLGSVRPCRASSNGARS